MAREQQVRTILVKADTRGAPELKKIARELDGLNKSVKTISTSMKSLGNAFNAIAGFSVLGFGIREIADMADSMQLLGDRIRSLSPDIESSNRAMEGLFEVANRTKQPLDAITGVYARLAASTKNLGITTGVLLDVTETLQNAFRLSGTSAQEANSAAIQLAQGLASGQLRGQELRSVLEANVEIGDILEKTFKKSRGELYKFAEQGRITASGVMLALLRNQEQVNERAKDLGQTFGQTLTLAMNKVQKAIGDLNKEFKLNDKFAAFVDILIEKFTLLATLAIPALIYGLAKLGLALKAFAVSNPILLTITAITAAFLYLFDNLEDFTNYWKRWSAAWLDVLANVIDGMTTIKKRFTDMFMPESIEKAIVEGGKRASGALREQANKLRASTFDGAYGPSKEEFERERAKQEREAALKKLEAQQKKEQAAALKAKDMLIELNKAYMSGTINAEQYYSKLDSAKLAKINEEFKEGKDNLLDLNNGVRQLIQLDFNRYLRDGVISMEEFKAATDALAKVGLDEKLKAGTISLIEYRKEINGLTQDFNFLRSIAIGAQDYLESIGTVGNQVADVMKNAFGSLENAMIDSAKGAADAYQKMADAILEDIARVIIRTAILQPIAQGISGMYGAPEVSGSYSVTGGYLGVDAAFAKGGIVSGPTYFGMNNGVGLMGESGPEAIIPLARSSDGSLGISASQTPVVVNITNNSGAEISQTESSGPNGERMIDILITSKVKEAFASGAMDRTMSTAYGIRRKGS